MRKKFVKTLLCLSMAGAVLMAGNMPTYAAEDTNNTVEATSSVSSVSVTKVDDALSVSFSGTGSSFKVYVNDVFYNTYYNSVDDSAYSDSFYFYNYAPGATYTFKVVPYNSAGTAGTAKSVKKEMAALKLSSVNVYNDYTSSYDDKGYYTGYYKPGICVRAEVSNGNSNYEQTFQIFRSTKKDSGYKKIATTSTYYDTVWYYDYSIVPGKKYYYKVTPVSKADDVYFRSPKYGKQSKAYAYTYELNVSSIGAYYDNVLGGVSVSTYSDYGNAVSGYEIYRSTKEKSGYKKIATNPSRYYLDKTVKSGNTYYYKAKAYYYDINSGKTYVSDFSEPIAVKVLLGNLYVSAEQTGSNKVKLTWEKVKGVNKYEIYYKSDINGDAYKLLTTTAKTEYEVKNLKSNMGYNFKVKSVSNSGSLKKYHITDSEYIYVGFKAPTNIIISKKTVTTTSTKATFKNTLKWDRVYGATGYIIEGYNSKNEKFEKIAKITKGSTTSYTFTNSYVKNEGSKYGDIRIAALKGSKTSDYNYVYGTSSLNAPEGIKVKRNSNSSVKISWNKVAGATNYYIYRYTPMGNSVYVGNTTSTSFVDKNGISPGLEYTYSVEANNSNLYLWSYSNNVSYTHKLGTATISSVKNSSSKKAVLKWKEAPYAKKYIIYRSTSKNGTYKKVATTSKLTYTDSGLTKGNTYYYKIAVQTKNYAGITVNSSKSAAKAVKITK